MPAVDALARAPSDVEKRALNVFLVRPQPGLNPILDRGLARARRFQKDCAKTRSRRISKLIRYL